MVGVSRIPLRQLLFYSQLQLSLLSHSPPPTGAQPSAITPYWCAVSRDCFLLVRGSAQLLFLQVRWVQGACTVVQRLFLVRSECAMPASQSTFAFSALYLLFVLAFSFVILYEPLIPWNRPGARPPPRDPRSKI